MTVGELARAAGLRASAVRYYERLGLVPSAPRRNGRREFDRDALAHLALVQFARYCGFTVKETRQLVTGFSARTALSDRWRALARTKMREMDERIRQARDMKALLGMISRCQCGTALECGRKLLARAQPSAAGPPPRSR